MSSKALKRIRQAYYRAEREQPADYDPLPKWETLPIQVREAIIHVYHEARRDALSEIKGATLIKAEHMRQERSERA